MAAPSYGMLQTCVLQTKGENALPHSNARGMPRPVVRADAHPQHYIWPPPQEHSMSCGRRPSALWSWRSSARTTRVVSSDWMARLSAALLRVVSRTSPGGRHQRGEPGNVVATSASVVHANAAHLDMYLDQSSEQALFESTTAVAADANAVPKKLAPVAWGMERKQHSEQAMLQGGPLEHKVVTRVEVALRSLGESLPLPDAWSTATLPTPLMANATYLAWLRIEL